MSLIPRASLIKIAKAALLEGAGEPETQHQRRAQEAARRKAAERVVKAVLDAIAEPSEAMFCAGDEAIVEILNAQSFLKEMDEATPAQRCWRAMIAALRKEVSL